MSGTSLQINNGENFAYFSPNDFDNFNLSTPALNAGTVRLNNIVFKNCYNNSNYYADTTGTLFYPALTWEIFGGALNSFTYTNNNTYPTLNGFNSWPDTISVSAGFNVNFPGITNTDQMEMFLYDNVNPMKRYTFQSPITSFSFSPSNLTSIITGTTVGLQINLYKNNIQTINGKKINFRSTGTYSKFIWFKN